MKEKERRREKGKGRDKRESKKGGPGEKEGGRVETQIQDLAYVATSC